jgi:methionine synthase II (cobalamin-independent)
VPCGKTVVLGLISSKIRQMESGDELIQRIKEASQYVSLENPALSLWCGFTSAMAGNILTEDKHWAKLRLVVEAVRRVWG